MEEESLLHFYHIRDVKNLIMWEARRPRMFKTTTVFFSGEYGFSVVITFVFAVSDI